MNDATIALYRSPPSGATSLAVTGFGRQRVTSRLKNRRLPTHAVVMVERGHGWLQSDKAGTFEISGPALFWLPTGTVHGYGPDPGESWDERWALFSGALADEWLRQRLIDEAAPMVPLENPREMRHLFTTLQDEFAEDNPLGLAASAATLYRIVIEAARQTSRATASAKTDATIEKVVEALEERAFAPVDMTALASEFGLSPATLRRRFAAATGLSPKAFQLRLRIDQAKQLLTTSDLAIEAIASTIGLDDAFYFSRLFQDRERCSPSEFRCRHRRA
ncbi:AraC family transcriptional regulator [Rhizobium sp. 16-449-1b]|uniref:helix-turn-helix domain-containing protein n=1 Tax=Rhizobium sp. 16-449-1b TaxID=2819989 RepID=UPI001ADBD200|nr:AraC family transcriptional regulator [Rhizobium sp. 16-449-1b]MBO9194754.1 AraC family transcriptional regulator [Rhizobium sp. 16-449-1b]